MEDDEAIREELAAELGNDAALDAINGTQRIAIVVMTALPKERIPEAARRRARSILTKPFTLAAVAAAVRAALVD